VGVTDEFEYVSEDWYDLRMSAMRVTRKYWWPKAPNYAPKPSSNDCIVATASSRAAG
jgi:hypothetical protein